MEVLIVGAGKLANELLRELQLEAPLKLSAWPRAGAKGERAIVVHAGSGRELPKVVAFCRETHSPLIELSTGSALESTTHAFPVVMCPNTNLLMLKFMSMLARCGGLFEGYDICLTESHQAGKTSTPGTALAMAQSLGVDAAEIVSVRNPEEQGVGLKIPSEHLARHAYHRIEIRDAVCAVSLETRVYGASPYAGGVAKIVAAIAARELENRCYAINEFVDKGWV